MIWEAHHDVLHKKSSWFWGFGGLFRFHVWGRSYSICPSLASCPRVSSMLSQMAGSLQVSTEFAKQESLTGSSGQEEIEDGKVILLVPLTPQCSILSVSLCDKWQLSSASPLLPSPPRIALYFLSSLLEVVAVSDPWEPLYPLLVSPNPGQSLEITNLSTISCTWVYPVLFSKTSCYTKKERMIKFDLKLLHNKTTTRPAREGSWRGWKERQEKFFCNA